MPEGLPPTYLSEDQWDEKFQLLTVGGCSPHLSFQDDGSFGRVDRGGMPENDGRTGDRMELVRQSTVCDSSVETWHSTPDSAQIEL